MNIDKEKFHTNLRHSIYFKERERIKKKARERPTIRKLRRKPIKSNTNRMLLMITKDEDTLKSVERNLFRSSLRNQIFLKKFKAEKMENGATPRLSMPEIKGLREKVRRIARKLKKRVFNHQKILPGMRESLRKMENEKRFQRIVEFGITNSSFFGAEKEFDGKISKDSFFRHKSSDIGIDKFDRFKREGKRINSLDRRTTRKKIYRMLKNGYGVQYFMAKKKKKNEVLRRRDITGGDIQQRKNLAQSFC